MKSLSIKLMVFVFILCTISVSSCKKGDPGVDGNANVTQINFGTTIISPDFPVPLALTGITKSIAEKSVILSYGKISNYWYQLPGFGPYGIREYRTFFQPTDPYTVLLIQMVVGSGLLAEKFDNIRVLVIPANTVITGRGVVPPYDINDYESMRRYFNLPE